MNDKTDFDRAVDRWMDDGSDATPPQVIDAVLLAVRSTPQERDFRVPWRTASVTSYPRVAAVIALVVIGSTAAIFTFGPGGPRFGGTNAMPSPSPVLIARGHFVEHDWGEVEFEATLEGSSVTGRMAVATASGTLTDASPTFDLQCVMETADGLVMIGGFATVGNQFVEVGTPACVVVKRGSPYAGNVGIPIGQPALETPDCLANMDRWLQNNRRMLGDTWEPQRVLDGSIEFGP